MTNDFDNGSKIPSEAGTPEDLPPETSEARHGGVPRDHIGTFAADQKIKSSIEPLLATAAAIQQQTKLSIEPLLATAAAAIERQTKLAIEPLLAIQQQTKSSIEPLLAIQQRTESAAERLLAIQQQTKSSIEPLLAISAMAQQQIEAFSEPVGLSANTGLSLAQQLLDWTKQYNEAVFQIARTTSFKLPETDDWIRCLAPWIPSNLRGIRELDSVFSVTLEEGIPLCWIPKSAIVTELTEADGPQERLRVLAERQDDILDDCEDALAQESDELAAQCREAIRTLRAGLYGAAQSHASNIIDSVMRSLGSNGARKDAVELAERSIDDLPVRFTAETLTLRPVARALTSWWPNNGTPPPAHFSRHATSHAVGHPGLFRPEYALTAIMLATSLTVQFGAHPPADDGSPTSNNDRLATGSIQPRSESPVT